MRRTRARQTHRTLVRTRLPAATWRTFGSLLSEPNEIMKDMLCGEDVVHELAILHVRPLPLADHEVITRAIAEITRLRKLVPHKTRKSTKKKHRA